MWCNIAQILLQILLILLTCSYGIYVMVVAYTIFTVLWLAVWQWQAHRLIGIRIAEVLADTMPFMLSAAAVMAVTHFATRAIPNLALLLLSRIVIASLLYLAIMKIAKVEILNECLRFVRKKK